MTAAEQLRQIQARKEKRLMQTRRKLMQLAGTEATGRPAQRGFMPRTTTPGGFARSPEPQYAGQINVRRGYMPSETEIVQASQMAGGAEDDRLMAELGTQIAAENAGGGMSGGGRERVLGGRGNPRQSVGTGMAGGTSGGMAGLPPEMQAYLADVYAKDQAAFNDTQARIGELRAGHADKRQRTLDRVENYGIAQQQLNAEKKAESLKTQRAVLQARGLSNSSDLPAWMARNDRDWGLVDQKLSEDVDDRAIRYDTALTNEYLGAIERINNIPPNMPQAMDMALKYGASGNGMGYGGVDAQLGAGTPAPVAAAPTPLPQRRRKVLSAMSARAGARLGAGMLGMMNGTPDKFNKKGELIRRGTQGASPVTAAAQAFPGMSTIPHGIMYGTANTSNRYPTTNIYPAVASRSERTAQARRQNLDRAANRRRAAQDQALRDERHRMGWGNYGTPAQPVSNRPASSQPTSTPFAPLAYGARFALPAIKRGVENAAEAAYDAGEWIWDNSMDQDRMDHPGWGPSTDIAQFLQRPYIQNY
jgi:hypothetical protein